MLLWGKEYTREELMKRIGDTSQLFGVRKSVLDDGAGRGMRIIDVYTATGLKFTVLPDRGMDIGVCTYKGIPISFVSKTGYVSPYLYDHRGNGFLRSFTAGLLTTCGYTHVGPPCEDGGEQLGLHGRATSLPADEVCAEGTWIDNEYKMVISGKTREAAVFGENIRMHRTITVNAGESKIVLRDVFENLGFEAQPIHMLYHCNFGWPIVSEHTMLETSECNSVEPRDDNAALGIEQSREFDPPIHAYKEQCFFYDMICDSTGRVYASLCNKEIGITMKLSFYKEQLPYFTQWKQMGEGDYVCGLEPGTGYPEGRVSARDNGRVYMLKPGEKKENILEIEVLEQE
jgi:hypothetical protein